MNNSPDELVEEVIQLLVDIQVPGGGALGNRVLAILGDLSQEKKLQVGDWVIAHSLKQFDDAEKDGHKQQDCVEVSYMTAFVLGLEMGAVYGLSRPATTALSLVGIKGMSVEELWKSGFSDIRLSRSALKAFLNKADSS